jgi:hypothetical protein
MAAGVTDRLWEVSDIVALLEAIEPKPGKRPLQAEGGLNVKGCVAMSDRIHELLNRNLQEVFGEGDAGRRRAAVEELYTDDCVLYVPPGVLVGRDAVDKFAGDLRATHPHFVYTPYGEPQALHNAGRLAWGSGPRGEKPNYTGLDVIIVRGDKIAALYVFLDSMPS